MRPLAPERAKPVRPTRIAALCAVLAAAFGAWSVAHAGTLPNISGAWYAGGNPNNRCSINQSGSSVSLTNERGATATGTFTDPSTVDSNWGPFGGGHITGHISGDLRTITWSNGTYWTRASGSRPAPLVPSATITPKPVVTPNPWRYIHWSNDKIAPAPIHVFSGWAAVKRDGTWVTGCVSFKNTSSLVAKTILFEFLFQNHSGQVEESKHFEREGTFSPDIAIHGYDNLDELFKRPGHHGYYDNCWGKRVDTEAAISRLSQVRYFAYRIERVQYADGTEWPEHHPLPTSTASPL